MNFKKFQDLLTLPVLVSSLVVVMTGCSKSDSTDATADLDPAQSISESAVSEAGSQASASEGSASPFISGLSEDFQKMDYVDPESFEVHPFSACTFTSNRSTCTANVSTIVWNGCTLGSAATLTGGWTETWSGGFCANGASPAGLTNGASVNRVTTGTGEVLLTGIGASLKTSTTAHTAYNGTAINGNGITVSNAAGTRTVAIDGLRKILTSPRGNVWFDHSIVAMPGLSVTGTRAAGTRVVSGNSTLYHNLAKYTAAHTFNAVTWGNASCCYPTSGSVTTSLSGSTSGTLTLNFAPGATTCGQATFTNAAGTASTVTLTQCH